MVRGCADVTWPLARSRLVRKCHLVYIDITWKRSAQCRRPSAGDLNRSAGALAPRGRGASRAWAPCGGAAAVRSQRRRSGGAPSLCFF